MGSRIDKEKQMVAKMIRLYCRHKEGNAELCAVCSELIEYAHARLDCCRHGEVKPPCRSCAIHCYRPDMRAKIREVMRFSGPRMLLYCPLTAMKHYWPK